jgi:RHS repeat-associated protein
MLNNSGDRLNTYSYNYDQIGNRIQTTKDNNITSYTSNIVNQYTQINTSVPTYDQDGNMLTNGEWSYSWNGENRMISAQTTTRKVEFAYDYMGRCFERKEYTAVNNSWNLDQTVYIVYDDYKQIAEYVNGELHQQYAWDVAGLDTVAFMGKNNSTYMYWTDGNKNVLKLFDATGVLASYSYDPFGKVTASEGLLATDNPFRFSSEYHNDITDLVEYIYRKYDPVIGRWINRDPLEEQGGVNLYMICANSVISAYDMYGQDWLDNIANFSAGVGDSLTMGLTSGLRKLLDIDYAVNYSSGSYVAGEVTEFAVETTITFGGTMLRKTAIKYAGKWGRRMLVPETKKLKKLLGVSKETTGQVHHINPIREGRFPCLSDLAVKNGT